MNIDSHLQARRNAADAIRRLTPVIAWGSVPEATLDAIAQSLNDLADTLHEYERGSRYGGTGGIRLGPGATDNASLWESHCVLGASHAYAAPVVVDATADLVIGRARWGAAYEGQRGFVHGGALASAFDVMLGHAAAKFGSPVVTGTLTLRFTRSVPIDVDVTIESRLVDVEGRKVRVEAVMKVAGETTVEGSATFITVGAERFGGAE